MWKKVAAACQRVKIFCKFLQTREKKKEQKVQPGTQIYALLTSQQILNNHSEVDKIT